MSSLPDLLQLFLMMVILMIMTIWEISAVPVYCGTAGALWQKRSTAAAQAEN